MVRKFKSDRQRKAVMAKMKEQERYGVYHARGDKKPVTTFETKGEAKEFRKEYIETGTEMMMKDKKAIESDIKIMKEEGYSDAEIRKEMKKDRQDVIEEVISKEVNIKKIK